MTSATATPKGGSLRRASALMASGSMVSRMLGIIRNAMLSVCVGALVVNNAFNVANILPNYIYILLAGGLLNAILIPQITKAMKDPDGGTAQVDRLVTLILCIVVPVSVLVTVLAKPIIAVINHSSGELFDLTVLFAYLTMPQVLFYCLYVLFGQILNARGQFAAFMWAPVLANVVQIAGMSVWIVKFGHLAVTTAGHRGAPPAYSQPGIWTHEMVWWLAGTSTLGIAAQALVLVIPLWRGGFRYRPRFDFRGHGLRQAGSMVGWAFGALLVSQAGGLLLNYVLSVVTDRNPTVAGYGVYTAMFTIFMIPHSLVTTTIVTALFPRLANAVHDGDVDAQRAIVRRCLTTPAVAVIPLTAAALALGRPGIRLLLPGYSESDVTAAHLVFAAMVLGMWPFGIKSVQERYTFAREDGRGTLGFQLLVSGVALVFTLLGLVVPDRIATMTVALGLTVSSVVGAVAFVHVARGQLGDLRLHEVVRLYVRLTLASALSGVLAWAVATFVTEWIGSGLLWSFIALVVGGMTFAGAFLLFAGMLRLREVDELLSPLMSRLRRTAPGRRTA